MLKELCITMDMDWAPDEVIDHSMAILDRFNIKATLFMTNKTDASVKGHELALHPNFTSLDLEKHFQERLELFPDAKGTRSHSFFFTERFRPIYEKLNLEYESNVMMYRQNKIAPYYMSPSTLEVPLFWMDNFYMEMEKDRSFIFPEAELDAAALTVFDFHPVHVFLNNNSMELYNDAKKYYHEPKELEKYRNTKSKGTEDYLVQLLEYAARKKINCKTLIEITRQYKTKA